VLHTLEFIAQQLTYMFFFYLFEVKATFIVKLTGLDWKQEYKNEASPLRAKLVENVTRNVSTLSQKPHIIANLFTI
jgi:hypothetical protein